MSKDINILASKMLCYLLDNKSDCLEEIISDIMSFKRFYLVAAPETSAEEWAQKSFAAYIAGEKLIVFLSPEEAISFAISHKATLANGAPMTVCSDAEMTGKIVNNYVAKELINGIRVYTRPPLFVLCPISCFTKNAPKESGSMVMVDNTPDEIVPVKNYALVPEIKQVLDCADVAVRRKLDPGLNFENMHSMVEKLLQANQIDPDELDKELELPQGFMRNFCVDRVGGSAAKQVIVKLLEKFGIIEYLYQFKGQCSEVAAEIKKANAIDIYVIKPSKITTKEKFKLIRIKRGHDYNGAYVYGLTLKSKKRQLETIVSTPLSFIIGKEYELGGLEPIMDESEEKTEATPARIPSSDEQEAILAKLEPHPPKKTFDKPAQPHQGFAERQLVDPDYVQSRKNDVIRYFKRQRGDNFQAAEASYNILAKYEDILDEFWQYIRNNKAGKLSVRDYTAKRLMSLHYKPYDAYCMLAKLRDDPKGTLQELKYRETDPQWQNK